MFNRDSLTPIFSDRSGRLAAEWRALSRERNPEFFNEGVLALAQRAEAVGEVETAARIYGSASGEDRFTRLAGERLAILRGGGDFGARAEHLLRSTARQALDPSLLFGMCAAGTVFRLTRLAALSRFASSAGTPFGAIGKRLAANLIGYGAEALSFPLLSRAADSALGRSHAGESLARQIASSYLTLGALRFSGSLGRWLGNSGLASQAAMFGGILLGQYTESFAGLRSTPLSLSEAFGTLLQFNVAARVSHRLMPEGYQAWEQELEARAVQQSAALRPTSWLPGWEAPLGLASAGIRITLPRADLHSPLMMASRIDDRGGSRDQTSAVSPGQVPPPPKSAELQRLTPRDDLRPRRVAPLIRLMKAHGVYWLVDSNSEGPPRETEVRVGEHILEQRGSMRVRDGDIITIGNESLVFSELTASAETPAAENDSALGPIVATVPDSSLEFFEHWSIGEEKIIGGEPGRPVSLLLRGGRALEPPRADARTLQEYELQLRAGEESAGFRIVWHEGEIEIRSQEFRNLTDSTTFVFSQWLARHAAIRASRLTIRAVNQPLTRLLESGLIHSRYAMIESRELNRANQQVLLATTPLENFNWGKAPTTPQHRQDLITEPDPTLIPGVFGPQFQAAAGRVFDRWLQAKQGIRMPSLVEIEQGHALPTINRIRTEHSMNRILGSLIKRRSRFLEIGYGERTETLEAVARRGGISLGLERDGVYPKDATREEIESGPVDVLFINGSPFLFYAHHVVTLPAALDVLKHFDRTRWVLIQSYNPRTPFEMLRHAEVIHRLKFDVMYYRATPSREIEPVFPTDHGDRENTYNSVLIARRAKP